jgi:hypothetical protein
MHNVMYNFVFEDFIKLNTYFRFVKIFTGNTVEEVGFYCSSTGYRAIAVPCKHDSERLIFLD